MLSFSVVEESDIFYYAIEALFFTLLNKISKSTNESDTVSDAVLGNLLILGQIYTMLHNKDKFLNLLLDEAFERKKFVYPSLVCYIVDDRMLEELVYASTNRKVDLRITASTE